MAELCPFDVTPLAIPRFVNNLPVYRINYVNQDFNSIRARTLDLLKTNFANEFNDISESSLGVMLIECWAGIADMLSFKIDQLANELYIDTVTEIENAFRLAKLVGYKPRPPLPAKAMFYARINSVYQQDLILKTPISINLDGLGFDVGYELYAADSHNNPIFDTDIVIPAGAMFTEAVVGLEGSSRRLAFKSNGKSGQIFTLPHENVFYGSIKVVINDTAWEEVDHFTESYPKPEYMVEYDAFYKPSIIFGDNRAGQVPPPDSSIQVRFRMPNKSTSEIVSGAFDTKVFASIPGLVNSVIVNVKNYTKSEYGYPGEGIIEIRKNLPSYLRTQNRAVTGADYKYLADTFSTAYDGIVGKSNVLLRNHGCAGNVIDIVVLAQTGDSRLVKANDNLKASLLEHINNKKIFTDHVCIKDGDVLYVDININASLNKNLKKYETEIRNKITDKIESFFNLPNWGLGQPLKEKDIIKSLATIKEVKQFDIAFVTNKGAKDSKVSENVISANYNEIIRPDNIGINFTYESEGR